jgi:hypothetical protein
MLQAAYPRLLEEQSAVQDEVEPANPLAVLVWALQHPKSYEITERHGELFIAARAPR